MTYNKSCPNSINDFCAEPSDLLQMIVEDLPAGSQILDIGSAQGRDALYLAGFGHHITAVEISETDHNILVNYIAGNKIENIFPVNADIQNFDIEKNKYFLISLQHVLQFLPKVESLKLVNEVKEKVCPGGLIVISAFTYDDPSYRNISHRLSSYFEKQELLKLFADFEIINYFEKTILDTGHLSTPAPHYHGITEIIAKKI